MIDRFIEKKIIKTVNYFPVTCIIGPRQVGKTTLARKISKLLNKDFIYIDLENPRDLIKLSDPNLFFEAHINKCVILDEIQLKPELFSIIRSMVDQNRVPSRFILLGSASPLLIRSSSQTLAGRVAFMELSGLNVLELRGKKMNKLWMRGGFPDAFLAPDDEMVIQWHDNFVRTYVERDLPLLGLGVSPVVLRNLWMMIAHMHGNVVNYSNIGKSLELSSTTIKKYLNFLENAFLIRQLQPFYMNTKKRIVKSPKVFIRDTGVLHNLLNISTKDELEGHPIKGNSFEGFAIEQIIQTCDSGYSPFFYRTHHGAECDLLLTKASKPVYAIEIKYSSAPKLTRSNTIGFNDVGARNQFIVTPDAGDYLLSKHIRVCSLNVFLEKYLK